MKNATRLRLAWLSYYFFKLIYLIIFVSKKFLNNPFFVINMFIDIAIPKGNEEKFIERAKKLETKGLIFLYKEHKKENLDKIKSLNSKEFPIYSAFLVKDKIYPKYDYYFSNGERKDFESKKTNMVFDLEIKFGKDKHHYRSSGLNQVLCGLAKEKDITIGFNFQVLLTSKKRDQVLGRMFQNIMLCKKYKNKILIASFAKKPNELRFWKDLISFGVVLGLSRNEAKQAVLNRKV